MTGRMPLRLALVTAALLVAASAFAQVAQPPPRPSRPRFGGGPPLDPNRVRHDLTLDASLLGGYEDNVAPFGHAPIGVDLRPSATMTVGDIGLRYSVGTAQKGLDITGHGFGNYASTLQSAGLPPNYGGDVAVGGRVGLGRRTKIVAAQNLQVSPYASLGIFGGLSGSGSSIGGLGGAGIAMPEGKLSNALFEGRVFAAHTSTAVTHEWTRKLSTVVGYSYSREQHEDRTQLDNRSHLARLGVTRRIGRATSVTGSYARASADRVQAGRSGTNVNHLLDGGVSQSREISRTRSLSWSLSGGATHVDSFSAQLVRQRYWLPTVSGFLSVDLGRSWTASVDWRQTANVVPSPVFAPTTFLSRTAVFSVGGHMSERIELVFSGANSSGSLGASVPGEDGRYKGLTGNAQARIGLTRWWSAIVSVNHYRASLTDIAAATLGTAPDFRRNSVMVGFAWSVPLLGRTRMAARGGRK